MCLVSSHVQALPTLQAYLTNSVAGDRTSPTDQDTWFNTASSSDTQHIELIASYGVNSAIESITDGYLVLTVSPNDPNPGPASFRFSFESSPGMLTEIVNIRDYRYEDDAAFEAALAAASGLNVNFNGHSPYGMPSSQVDVYGIPLNVLQAGLGNFDGLRYMTGSSMSSSTYRPYYLKNCNADIANATGCTNITNSGLLGEAKTIGFTTQNANFVHVDFVAKVTETTTSYRNKGKITTTKEYWTINPGSHDSTISVPEPATLTLFAAGLLLLTLQQRRILARIRSR